MQLITEFARGTGERHGGIDTGCASKLAEVSVEAKAKQAAGLRFIRQTRFKDDAIPIDCFG